MKRLIIFLLFCFVVNIASAQWSYKFRNNGDNDHLLYAQGGMMVGNSSGGNLGLNFVYNSKYSIQVGFSATSKQYESMPKGTKSTEEVGAFVNSITSVNNMENYYCMVGRHFNLNIKKAIRIVVQGGAGMSLMIDIPDKDNFSFDSSERTNEMSLVLNSKVEFPVADLVCLSLGPTYIVNKQQSFFGVGLGIAYGIVKSKTTRS